MLVTGASGFVASALIAKLALTDSTLRLVARRKPSQVLAGNAKLEIVQIDLTRAPWEDLLEGVDFVFHLAGQTSVAAADAEPSVDWTINVGPMVQLLNASRRSRRKLFFLLAGTETQCGLPRYLPLDESHPDQPVTTYDRHKLHAERLLLEANRRGDVLGSSLRLTTLYGPGPAPSAEDRGVVNRLVRRALLGEPVTIYGDGGALRDFLHVRDAAEAFLAAASRPNAVAGRHYLVGSGTPCTLAELGYSIAAAVEAVTGRHVTVTNVAPPADRSPIQDRSVSIDPSRFRIASGWEPRTKLSDGLRETARALTR